MNCDSCGAAAPANAMFCAECGSPVKKVCPHCGAAKAVPETPFCQACGARLTAQVVVAQAPLAPAWPPGTTAYIDPMLPPDPTPASPAPAGPIVLSAVGTWLVYLLVSGVGTSLRASPPMVVWLLSYFPAALGAVLVTWLVLRGRLASSAVKGLVPIVASYPIASAVTGLIAVLATGLRGHSVTQGVLQGLVMVALVLAGAAIVGQPVLGLLSAIFIVPVTAVILAVGVTYHPIGSGERGWGQFGGAVWLYTGYPSFFRMMIFDLSAPVYVACAVAVAVAVTRVQRAARHPYEAGVPTHSVPGSPTGSAHAMAGSAPGTNGFAIAALVLGVLGGSVLGLIFGFVALSQIKRTGQGGRGLAIAGVVLSAIWIVVVIAFVVAVASSTSQGY